MISIRPRTGELLIGLGLAVLALYIMGVTWQMPHGRNSIPGPGFIPFWTAILLLIVGTIIAFRSITIVKAGDTADEAVSIGSGDIVFTVAALAGLTLILEPLGFVIAASVFGAAMLLRLSRLRWYTCIVSAVSGSIIGDMFFRSLLGLYLPRSSWIFEFIQ